MENSFSIRSQINVLQVPVFDTLNILFYMFLEIHFFPPELARHHISMCRKCYRMKWCVGIDSVCRTDDNQCQKQRRNLYLRLYLFSYSWHCYVGVRFCWSAYLNHYEEEGDVIILRIWIHCLISPLFSSAPWLKQMSFIHCCFETCFGLVLNRMYRLVGLWTIVLGCCCKMVSCLIDHCQTLVSKSK